MHIVIISPFFSPNIGGVETHLSDLVAYLIRNKFKVTVHTYQPIMISNSFPAFEQSKGLRIYRHNFPIRGLFNKLESYPPLQLLYLTPILLLKTLIWFSKNYKTVDCIHSHGINAALIGNVTSHIYRVRHINSTHAVYENLNNHIVKKIVTACYNKCNKVLCLSMASKTQLQTWGVKNQILDVYKYWIDLSMFKPTKIKQKKPTVLFVGRLLEKKGINILLDIAIKNKNINFIFAGSGPLQKKLIIYSKKHKNISYVGAQTPTALVKLYNSAWITCVPSLYPEGFGRVIAESLACNTPVVASKIGGIAEAMDDTVGLLTEPTLDSLQCGILNTIENIKKYKPRQYAQINYSDTNAKLITRHYQ